MDTDWKIIACLTDKTVLGTEGIALKEPRRKVRTILINEEGKYALTYEAASRIHTLPGGGIEEGEDPKAALQREVYEETGCSCDMIFPLGIVCENRYHADTAVTSYYYVTHTKTKNGVPQFTDEEIALGTVTGWFSLTEALHLIKDAEHDTDHKKFLRARDLSVLEFYIREYVESGSLPQSCLR